MDTDVSVSMDTHARVREIETPLGRQIQRRQWWIVAIVARKCFFST